MARLIFHVDMTAAAKHVKEFRRRLPRTVAAAEDKSHAKIVQMASQKPYPPERPEQTYVRTDNLEGSWEYRKVKANLREVVFELSNKARQRGNSYATFPLGDDEGRQAWMHAGRWWTGLAFYKSQTPMRIANIQAALIREWERTR